MMVGCEVERGESANMNDPNRQVERDRLVDDYIVTNRVKNPGVLDAIRDDVVINQSIALHLPVWKRTSEESARTMMYF